MPRRGRLHIPGGCYHVIGRGLERRCIFDAAEDKEAFLNRFEENLTRCQAQCLAWAMMSNHYHFLIRVAQKPLGKLMAPLLGGYAGYYNRKYRRSGYVFQNRFQSILCGKDAYLKELVRYIHLNPVRAGILEDVEDLERYRWTGHAAVFGKHRQKWHAVEEMLSSFGSTTRLCRATYRKFVSDERGLHAGRSLSGGGLVRSVGGWEVLSRLRKEHISCIGDERILGDTRFVEQSLKQDELKVELKSRLKLTGWNLDRLIAEVCTRYDVSEQALTVKTRQKDYSIAKSLICYWGMEFLGLRAREIAARLQLTHPAVSYRSRVGRKYCESNRIEFEDWIR